LHLGLWRKQPLGKPRLVGYLVLSGLRASPTLTIGLDYFSHLDHVENGVMEAAVAKLVDYAFLTIADLQAIRLILPQASDDAIANHLGFLYEGQLTTRSHLISSAFQHGVKPLPKQITTSKGAIVTLSPLQPPHAATFINLVQSQSKQLPIPFQAKLHSHYTNLSQVASTFEQGCKAWADLSHGKAPCGNFLDNITCYKEGIWLEQPKTGERTLLGWVALEKYDPAIRQLSFTLFILPEKGPDGEAEACRLHSLLITSFALRLFKQTQIAQLLFQTTTQLGVDAAKQLGLKSYSDHTARYYSLARKAWAQWSKPKKTN
jgi:hypothetical protein